MFRIPVKKLCVEEEVGRKLSLRESMQIIARDRYLPLYQKFGPILFLHLGGTDILNPVLGEELDLLGVRHNNFTCPITITKPGREVIRPTPEQLDAQIADLDAEGIVQISIVDDSNLTGHDAQRTRATLEQPEFMRKSDYDLVNRGFTYLVNYDFGGHADFCKDGYELRSRELTLNDVPINLTQRKIRQAERAQGIQNLRTQWNWLADEMYEHFKDDSSNKPVLIIHHKNENDGAKFIRERLKAHYKQPAYTMAQEKVSARKILVDYKGTGCNMVSFLSTARLITEFNPLQIKPLDLFQEARSMGRETEDLLQAFRRYTACNVFRGYGDHPDFYYYSEYESQARK